MLQARYGQRMVLQKLKRNPAMDGVDLFRRLDLGAGTHALDSEERIAAVFDELQAAVRQTLATPSSVRGWRAQAMFASLVAALDECQLLTFTDTGDVFYDGASVKPTDYLLVLRDGRRLAVDVKDVGIEQAGDIRKPVKLSASEHARMTRYADLIGAELFVAAYSPHLPTWLLISIDEFRVNPYGSYTVTLEHAMRVNEMAILGDLAIGVAPPLRCRLNMDESVDSTVGEGGRANFKVGGVEIGTGDGPVTGEAEKRLLWFLLMHSGWDVDEQAIVEEGKVVALTWEAFPPEPEESNRDGVNSEDFRLVGWLSGMYSRLFEGGSRDHSNAPSGLDISVEPGMLISLLPHDFKSEELRLWRLRLQGDRNREDRPDGSSDSIA